MPDDKEKRFGKSLSEVNNSISKLEKERKSLADKANAGNLSRSENKRFGKLDSELTEANEFKTSFEPTPGANSPSNEFTIDKNTVIGTGPTQERGLVPPPSSLGTVNNLPGAQMNQVPVTPAVSPTVPPIQVPRSGSEQIIQDTVAGIQGSDQIPGGNIDQAINTATFGSPLGAQREDPLINQGSELFRGINDPILKGNVSGQIIGNQPVFVPGGDFFSFDVLNNRKKAIQDAALQREEEKQALLSVKPPLVKDKGFQKNLNDRFYSNIDDFVAQAKQEYGADWDLKLKDQSNPVGREFVQSLSNFEFIAGSADQVTDLIGEIDADLESGDSVFSDETLQLRDDYNQLQGDFINGDIGGVVDVREKFNELKGFTNLDKIINDQDIDLEGQINQIADVVERENAFETTTVKKKIFEDQVRILAAGLAKNQMRDAVRNGYIDEEEIFQRLNARHGEEKIVNKKITNKSGSGGVKITIDPNSPNEGGQVQNIGGVEFNTGRSFDIPSNAKGLEGAGLFTFDQNGNPESLEGIQDFKANEIQNVEFVDENGQKSMKTVILADVTKKVPVLDDRGRETGKFKEEKVAEMIDLDSEGVRSRIKTDLFSDPANADQILNVLDQEKEEYNQGSLFEVSGTSR